MKLACVWCDQRVEVTGDNTDRIEVFCDQIEKHPGRVVAKMHTHYWLAYRRDAEEMGPQRPIRDQQL